MIAREHMHELQTRSSLETKTRNKEREQRQGAAKEREAESDRNAKGCWPRALWSRPTLLRFRSQCVRRASFGPEKSDCDVRRGNLSCPLIYVSLVKRAVVIDAAIVRYRLLRINKRRRRPVSIAMRRHS